MVFAIHLLFFFTCNVPSSFLITFFISPHNVKSFRLVSYPSYAFPDLFYLCLLYIFSYFVVLFVIFGPSILLAYIYPYHKFEKANRISWTHLFSSKEARHCNNNNTILYKTKLPTFHILLLMYFIMLLSDVISCRRHA